MTDDKQHRPKYNLDNFKFETKPQSLKKVILDQFNEVQAKKKKDEFDKMFIQVVKQKMKMIRMKLVVTHIPTGIKKSWVIETELDKIDKPKYVQEVKELVKIDRMQKRREWKKNRKQFDGAPYETMGGVFLGDNNGHLINEIGKLCTTNDPFVTKSPRKPRANYVGVELEFNKLPNHNTKTIGEALRKANLARFVQVVEDGSCGGFDSTGQRLRGFEVRVLLEEENFLEKLKKVCDALKALGFKTDASCGTHVHLDMRNRDVKRCYANLFKMQLLLRKFITTDRKHNIYCMKNTYPTFDEHATNATGRESRRAAINTHAYSKFRTLEVRMHHGTLDAEKLAPFIKLLLKGVNYNGTLEKPLHTLKQAKTVLNVEDSLFNDLATKMKSRGA